MFNPSSELIPVGSHGIACVNGRAPTLNFGSPCVINVRNISLVQALEQSGGHLSALLFRKSQRVIK